MDFFGHPAGTFKSLAILALSTGVPVIPAHSWREPDGSHVLRFEPPLPLVECEDVGEAIRRNSRAYNVALEPFTSWPPSGTGTITPLAARSWTRASRPRLPA